MNDSSHPFGLTTALIVAACFAAGCSDTVAPTPVVPQSAAPASDTSSPSSVVGIAPAEPAKDPQSTPSAEKSDVSKGQQSTDMPMPGQANDHSTLAPNASQKADAN
jgi:hypothetical protein